MDELEDVPASALDLGSGERGAVLRGGGTGRWGFLD